MAAGLEPIIGYLNSLTGRADLSILEGLLKDCSVTAAELGPLCKFGEQCYKRNLVASSPWFDFLVICWRPGQDSPIHDHAGSSCAFRIVQGRAVEQRFSRPKAGSDVVNPTTIKIYSKGELCLAEDTEIHRIINESATENLITLHIYSPPLRMNYFRDSADALPGSDHAAVRALA